MALVNDFSIVLARLDRSRIPETGRVNIRLAWCNYCEEVFEWIPEHIHSTKRRYNSDEIYPRCPYCNRYKTTVDRE